MLKFSTKPIAGRFVTEQEYYIEIEDGLFKGVCFNFDRLEFLGEDTDGNGRMAFEYELMFVPHHLQLKAEIQKQLEKVMSEILGEVMKMLTPQLEISDED